jgi:hypothetical protein
MYRSMTARLQCGRLDSIPFKNYFAAESQLGAAAQPPELQLLQLLLQPQLEQEDSQQRWQR